MEKNSTPTRTFAVLYSYPTWDRFYRGQRGVRVVARDQAHALQLIRHGYGGYSPCPDARIVRCKDVTARYGPVTSTSASSAWRIDPGA